MPIAHPLATGWLSAGGTGSANYDEFASDSEITAIIRTNPASALSIEMPHLAPQSLGQPFDSCLSAAAGRFGEQRRAGRYAAAADIVGLYRIRSADGATALGLWCMVDTNQISSRAGEAGLVIRNEDVFVAKVRQRVDLARALGASLSPVLLLQTVSAQRLHAALASAVTAAERAPTSLPVVADVPVVTDTDPAGRTHTAWAIGPGVIRQELLALAGGGELVVADGNHRSLAAQQAGQRRFLAVVTTPESVRIEPYQRLIADVDAKSFAAGLASATRMDRAEVPAGPGSVCVYTRHGAWLAPLVHDACRPDVDNLDHAVVERVLLGQHLGLDAGDERITYVGGDYPPAWLQAEVDAGRADVALLLAPVSVADFVAVNLARAKMPRKSTWFTPKARAGLVAAALEF